MSLKPIKKRPLKIGDVVIKSGGDYTFNGQVMAIFKKRSGKLRCAVENIDGILHIFNPEQLHRIND